jgi:type IX secretion system PorP/SprF family membrane protein
MKHLQLLIFFTTMLVFSSTYGQDFHMSQYDSNPLYLNPALTGFRLPGENEIRLNVNYRDQGGKHLATSYKTVAAGLDLPINQKFSIGQMVIDNKGANGAFNTFNLLLSSSYKIIDKLAENGMYHHLLVGLQMGLLQKSFNATGFVYDTQYSSDAPDGFDAALPSGESIASQTNYGFDANMGVFYNAIQQNQNVLQLGFSVYHFNQTDDSFNSVTRKTPMRFVLHGGYSCTINEALRILPQFFYLNQGNASELNLGLLGFYKITGSENEPMLGISYIHKDAIVLHGGLKQKNLMARISYDITTNYLRRYSCIRGGLELSIILFFGKGKN